MQLTVGQIIGKALKAYGVPYVAGLPGHGNWSMLDAFNDPISKLPFIQVLHEQSAVHIADAHYRVTGRPIAACKPPPTRNGLPAESASLRSAEGARSHCTPPSFQCPTSSRR